MNYFHTKRKHYRLSDLKNSTFAVAIFGSNVFFVEFVSLRSMYDWYISVPDKRCHEVIRSSNRKLVLDIDGECNVDIIIKCLKKILGDDTHVATYHSHGPVKTSWHLVVTNCYFEDHHYCKYIISILINQVGLIGKNIDMAVYSSVQFLRMEGSHKNERVKLRSSYHAISPYPTFREGLISCIDRCRKVTMAIPKLIPVASLSTVEHDTTAFKIRLQKGNITYLDRIRPSYCKLCERIHEHENIAITNAGQLICWRKRF